MCSSNQNLNPSFSCPFSYSFSSYHPLKSHHLKNHHLRNPSSFSFSCHHLKTRHYCCSQSYFLSSSSFSCLSFSPSFCHPLSQTTTTMMMMTTTMSLSFSSSVSEELLSILAICKGSKSPSVYITQGVSNCLLI